MPVGIPAGFALRPSAPVRHVRAGALGVPRRSRLADVATSLSPQQAIDRLRAAFSGPPGHRTLHAKGRFYTGTFTATPEATALCRAGHFDGQPHEVTVRWSNAAGKPSARTRSRTSAAWPVKFRLPDGSATDLLGQTSPRFPTDDPEVFVALTEATEKPLTPAAVPGPPPGCAAQRRGQRPGQGGRAADQLRGGHLLPDPRLRLARRRRHPHLGPLHLPGHRHQGRPAGHVVLGSGPAGRGDGGPAGPWPGDPRGVGPGGRRGPRPAPRHVGVVRGSRAAGRPDRGDRTRRRPGGRPDEPPRRPSSTRPASSTASSSPTTRSCATGPAPTRSRVRRPAYPERSP